MSLTYAYKDAIPIAKVVIEAENDSGTTVFTPVIDIHVDTGASHLTLPESLLRRTFGRFITQNVAGKGAGMDIIATLALLRKGKIHFLDLDNKPVFAEELTPLKIVMRNTQLLGRNVIDNQIYEFNGKDKTLKISFHSD